MENFDKNLLFDLAKTVAKKSYSPYSKLKVGCAVFTNNGKFYVGTNVENRSYGLTICAERVAITAAISDGATKILALAIFSPDLSDFLPPCGACRQVISEFCDTDCQIFLINNKNKIYKTKTGKLYPFDSLKNLKSI